ncbi:tetratricopeptide repeat protein [Bacteroides sp. OttesenSCG-928-D19]|nr:tetratricopeptide repeat protein [Bacteroides sp. OttesenSCG-928-D19]
MVSNLTHLINHPELLDRDTLYELRTLLARYPYCQTLRMLFLKNLYLLNDVSFADELRISALYVGDRRMLFYLIEGDKYVILPHEELIVDQLEQKESGEEGMDRTLSLIDAFLSSMPTTEEDAPQVNYLEYISDYTSYLENVPDPEPTEGEGNTEGAAEQPRLRGQELIDNFIDNAENQSITLPPLEGEDDEDIDEENALDYFTEKFPDDDDDDTYFTETLARIYIKQQRYDKAVEIIKKISLKYPKKSTYFADQIRFLEKLIINAKSK